MRKLLTGTCLLLACSILAGCGPKKEPENPPPPEEAAEQVVQVERWYQLNSTNQDTPADKRLHCEYTKVMGPADAPKVARADVFTSGSCDFDALKGQAGEPSKDFPRENFKNILMVLSGKNFDATKAESPSWDCAVIKVTTDKDRTLYGKDCELRESDNKTADPLAKTPSASAESAGHRLNELVGPVPKETM